MRPRVLVTGASSGLGRALALELGRSGRHVLLLARDEARLRETAREVAAAGGAATPCPADVRDAAAVARAVGEGVGDGGLDLAVHAAGILELGAAASFPAERFRATLETNLLGAANVVQAVEPHLAATRGRLVLVVSITGILALPGGFGAYAASKWGLRGYGESIRAELRARGIGLTLAFPSILDTPMVRQLGPGVPDVYRVFPWHAPDGTARAILADAAAGRDASFLTAGDRLAAFAMGAFPGSFTRALHAWIRWKAGRART